MDFETGKQLEYYFNCGWVVYSPVKSVCPFCNGILLENAANYDFLYCPSCAKRIMTMAKCQDHGLELKRCDTAECKDFKNNNAINHSKKSLRAKADKKENITKTETIEAVSNKIAERDQNRDKYIGDMSSLMMKGCRMSSYSCNSCNVPLLMTVDKSRLFCSKCGYNTAPKPEIEFDAASFAKDIVKKVQNDITAHIQHAKSNEGQEKEDLSLVDSEDQPEKKSQKKASGIDEDLRSKIADIVNLIAEPCSIDELIKYGQALHAVREAIDAVRDFGL